MDYKIVEFGPDGSAYGCGITVEIPLTVSDVGHSDGITHFAEPVEYKTLRARVAELEADREVWKSLYTTATKPE